MDNPGKMVDRLIAYWRGDPSLPEETRWICRRLTEGIARSLSAAELVSFQEEPLRHRVEIESLIERLLGPSPSSRPAVPEPAPRPEPGPGSFVQTLSSQGDGNVALNTGHVSGSLQIQAPPRTAKPAPGALSQADEKLKNPMSPIRILFLGANPADSTRLRLDEEVREIDHVLTTAELGARFELCQKWAVRASELQFYLLRHKPQIVHFSGHGSEENAILLEGEEGMSRPVAGASLARLFGQFNQRLRCVVLNACYSHDQATAIAEQVDCVIGMTTEVLDRVAIRFAASFYQALAFGCSVRAAYDLSCADLEIGELGQADVPRLIAVRRDPATLIFTQAM